MTSAVGARTLQPAAWRRAAGVILSSAIMLGAVLQAPVVLLLPETAPRWLVAIAVGVVCGVVLAVGLGIAYPRIEVEADGALRVRGARIEPQQIVSVRRSLSAEASAAYLVYLLRTESGRRLRVLVAGTPIRGLGSAELAVLREVIEASAIPAADDAQQVRTFVSENVLASGRRAEMNRGLVLHELGQLAGRHASAQSSSPTELVPPAKVTPQDDLAPEFRADDWAAEDALVSATAGRRRFRKIAFGGFVLACVATSVLLVIMVIREATGVDFGAANEDPEVFAMLIMMLVALGAGILWAIAADIDDAGCRRVSREWLATSPAERVERGLPTPFHTAWLQQPGGRMTSFALLVIGVVALFVLIAGPMLLVSSDAPISVGIAVTAVGVALSVGGIWGWVARRRARAHRVEWLVGAVGPRVTRSGSSPTP